jgi:Flp pilus assembly protein TadD
VATAVAALRQEADERARTAELERVRADGERAKAQAEAREQRRRRRVQLGLLAAVAALLLGVGAFAWWQSARLGRNAEAVSALLDQCEGALRAGDPDRAEVVLGAARKRASEGGAGRLAERMEGLGRDLDLLRALDEVDRFRWTPEGTYLPGAAVVAARFREAVGQFGMSPDAEGAAGAAARADGSAVRQRVVAAMDRILRAEKSAAVRAALRTLDAAPYRDAVRDAVLAGDAAGLVELANRPEALEQPVGFAAFLSEEQAVPLERRRLLLETAAAARPGELVLLMALANTYPIDRRQGLEQRLRWCQAAVAAAPSNPTAHARLGLVLRDRKDLTGAEAACREAIRLDPKFAWPHNSLGLVLHDRGDLSGAEAAYREAIRLAPKDALAHTNLGWLLHDRGDLSGAEAAYREAIRLDPNYALAHNNLGNLLRDRKDLTGAEAACREAIRLDPKFAFAHNNLGNALHDRGDLSGAEAAFREAIRLDPKYAVALSNLGNLLRDRGDLSGAEAACREAIRLDPKLVPAHNNLGWVLYNRADLSGAEAACREALRLNPKFALAHDNLGVVLTDRGDLSGAEAACREAIRLDPKDAWAHNHMGRVLQQKGDLDGAVAAYKRALQIEPNHHDTLRNLPLAEQMLRLLSRLPAVLAGKDEPKAPAEACAFARLCAQAFQQRYAAAARLFEGAFTADAKLAAAYRYSAACFAARAARGDGVDPPADPAGRAVLRRKALAWLGADLAGRKKQAASAVAAERHSASFVLSYWLVDTDLSGVRETKAVESLPADEQQQWRKFWAEVKAALAEARKPLPPPKSLPTPQVQPR